MKKYDVIVAGGGPSGIAAAVAAARGGLKTLLIERSAALGGLMISGLPVLGFIDRSGRTVLGGIAQEMVHDRMQEFGATSNAVRCPVHNSLTFLNPHWMRVICFEICDEAGVDIALYSELTDVKVRNGQIAGVTILKRGEVEEYETDILIDATGDGVAAYLAGAEFWKNEKMQPPSLIFTIGNVDISKVRSYVKEHPETIQLPDTYGVKQTYEQFLETEYFAFTGYKEFIEEARKNNDYSLPRDRIIFSTLPGKGEVMVNCTRVVGVDTTDANEVIKADIEGHRQIKELMKFFKKYAPGFENCYLSGISWGLGSRESRRIKGIKTLTSDALKDCAVPEDTIVLAGYNVDIHVPGTDKLYLQPVKSAIGIPYGCLVSKDVRGLMMAGRCISVDGDIYGLTRVMGACIGEGEAAGTAASLAVKYGVDPANVDVAELRIELKKNGGILE